MEIPDSHCQLSKCFSKQVAYRCYCKNHVAGSTIVHFSHEATVAVRHRVFLIPLAVQSNAEQRAKPYVRKEFTHNCRVTWIVLWNSWWKSLWLWKPFRQNQKGSTVTAGARECWCVCVCVSVTRTCVYSVEDAWIDSTICYLPSQGLTLEQAAEKETTAF